jgi:hypothetical protein
MPNGEKVRKVVDFNGRGQRRRAAFLGVLIGKWTCRSGEKGTTNLQGHSDVFRSRGQSALFLSIIVQTSSYRIFIVSSTSSGHAIIELFQTLLELQFPSLVLACPPYPTRTAHSMA